MNEKKTLTALETAAKWVQAPDCPVCGGKGKFLQRTEKWNETNYIICSCQCGHRSSEYTIKLYDAFVGNYVKILQEAADEFGRR